MSQLIFSNMPVPKEKEDLVLSHLWPDGCPKSSLLGDGGESK
jgi:hypothetical protein